jgi:hypothetical protein
VVVGATKKICVEAVTIDHGVSDDVFIANAKSMPKVSHQSKRRGHLWSSIKHGALDCGRACAQARLHKLDSDRDVVDAVGVSATNGGGNQAKDCSVLINDVVGTQARKLASPWTVVRKRVPSAAKRGPTGVVQDDRLWIKLPLTLTVVPQRILRSLLSPQLKKRQ